MNIGGGLELTVFGWWCRTAEGVSINAWCKAVLSSSVSSPLKSTKSSIFLQGILIKFIVFAQKYHHMYHKCHNVAATYIVDEFWNITKKLLLTLTFSQKKS